MECSDCGAGAVAFGVPEELRGHVDGEPGMAICSRCLALRPATPGDDPDFSAISAEFPTGEAGVALALALGLLESLALNREAIAALVERAERAGADPFLVMDRLAAQGSVEPDYGLSRRRQQLEQLLE